MATSMLGFQNSQTNDAASIMANWGKSGYVPPTPMQSAFSMDSLNKQVGGYIGTASPYQYSQPEQPANASWFSGLMDKGGFTDNSLAAKVEPGWWDKWIGTNESPGYAKSAMGIGTSIAGMYLGNKQLNAQEAAQKQQKEQFDKQYGVQLAMTRDAQGAQHERRLREGAVNGMSEADLAAMRDRQNRTAV